MTVSPPESSPESPPARGIEVLRIGPGVTVQDGGRPGWMSQGLSRGGALDRLALVEGAVLLDLSPTGWDQAAALEIPSFIEFRAHVALRLALSGARMQATVGGAGEGRETLAPWACHRIAAGQVVRLTPLDGGVGYAMFGAHMRIDPVLGARGAHLGAGLGRMLSVGDHIALDPDPVLEAGDGHGGDHGGGWGLTPTPRFSGGKLRLVAGPQTTMFSAEMRDSMEKTVFYKRQNGGRMGQRLIAGDEVRFAAQAGLSVVSDVITMGDVQMVGDGMPYVLLSECQTMGGYPRIGTILPADIPRLVQAPPDAPLRLRFVEPAEARRIELAEAARRRNLRRTPLIRDPASVNLLSMQLIGGVSAGRELEEGP